MLSTAMPSRFRCVDADREATIARHAAGVTTMLTIAHLSEFDAVRAVARRIPRSGARSAPSARGGGRGSARRRWQRAAHPKVVGIGETGLDFYYDHSPREAQRVNFRAHIAAARATGLPLIVHAREADEEIAQVLREEAGKGGLTGVMHCFSSGRALAEAALQIGFYISLSGIVTFKNAEELREIARDVPLDRLLVETDAPYLAPMPLRGKRNEPAFVTRRLGGERC
jgi:TatD DNase family protein